MKRKLILFLILVIFTGCNLSNNPTSKVEELLTKYQTLDSSINISYDSLSSDKNLDDKIKDRYKKIIKKQYENLSYEIKDEKIDGDTSTITTEIEVLDYKSIITKYDINSYDTKEYHEKLLNDLENAKDKITYTIDFNLTKDNKGNWQVDNLTTEQVNKILGIY